MNCIHSLKRIEIKMAIDEKSSYYDVGNIETIEIIKAKLTIEQYIGYLLGNIIKYSSRANWKNDRQRDAEKIKNYSNMLSDLMKELNNQTA